jgi:aminocarboxymuconate-semialdehyde decarboxylase
MLKIDMHTHIMPKHLPRWAEQFGYDGFIHLEHQASGLANMMHGTRFFRAVEPNCWDEVLRIADYAQYDTQVQVVCTIPVLFAYFAKAKDGLQVAEFLNDHIAELVQKHPKHYIGLATLPMQDVDKSVQELHRCHKMGLRGIQIGSNINDVNLHDPRFDPLWAACETLGMAVMVHPWEMMGEKSMQKYWLPWLVGMPAETTRALCSFIFGGVFDRFPKMRVCFSHAGGSFLPTLGRIEHGYTCRPDLVAIDCAHPPSHYLKHFWIDSITHDADMLAFMLKKVGSNRICLGSDYPFPLGDLTIGEFINTMGLSQTDHENIFHQSALEWLGLEKAAFET